ncbi:MAG: hypothetical protein U9O24_03745 [Campylobacterota bacterium]|nr:hypothetical protein [Campylobacterota bacterium]
MHFKKIILATCLLTNTIIAETSIGLNINDKDLELIAEFNMNSFTDYSSGTNYILAMNYLYVDEEHLTSIGFNGENSLQGLEDLSMAFGAKLLFRKNFLALPLEAKIKYTLPLTDTIPPTSLMGSVAYAPTVLSFSDAEAYKEFRIEAGMEPISNIHLFTGYRNIDTDYELEDINFNESFYFGMKIGF